MSIHSLFLYSILGNVSHHHSTCKLVAAAVVVMFWDVASQCEYYGHCFQE
jgi:hypothetical protein